MTEGDKRNVRLLQVSHRLSAKGYGSAQRTTDALARIKTELDELDGWAAGMPGGDGENTQPEAFMLRRYHWSSAREELRDAVLGIELAVQAHSRTCSAILGLVREDVPVCDGRSFAGASATWTPYSRDEDNGWYDPYCQDAANASGVCSSCQIRERRWRLAHGFEPRRATIAEEDAA